MTSTQYSKPVADFLESIGVTMTLQGPDKVSPPFATDGPATSADLATFPRKKHIHGDRWMVTFVREGKSFTTPFWDSYRDAELRWISANWMHLRIAFVYKELYSKDLRLLQSHGIKSNNDWKDIKTLELKPSPYDVLACVGKYHPGSHEEFCAEFGYNPDSMKDFETYQAVLREWGQVSRFFTTTELETLQEIAN